MNYLHDKYIGTNNFLYVYQNIIQYDILIYIAKLLVHLHSYFYNIIFEIIGEMGIVAGWGRLSEGGQLPSILQYVSTY